MIKAIHTVYTKTTSGYEEVDSWVEVWPDPEEGDPQPGETVWVSETHKVEWERAANMVEVFEIEDRYVKVAGHGRIETTETSIGFMSVEEYESICADAYIGSGINRRYTYREIK